MPEELFSKLIKTKVKGQDILIFFHVMLNKEDQNYDRKRIDYVGNRSISNKMERLNTTRHLMGQLSSEGTHYVDIVLVCIRKYFFP